MPTPSPRNSGHGQAAKAFGQDFTQDTPANIGAAVTAWAAIDILVLNASSIAEASAPSPRSFRSQIAVNLRTTMELLHPCATMADRGWGASSPSAVCSRSGRTGDVGLCRHQGRTAQLGAELARQFGGRA